jgi:hypothetical protein
MVSMDTGAPCQIWRHVHVDGFSPFMARIPAQEFRPAFAALGAQ